MRKIVQIAFEVKGSVEEGSVEWGADSRVSGNTESILHALCDDGSIWYLHSGYDRSEQKYNHEWRRWDLPEIPQEEEQPE